METKGSISTVFYNLGNLRAANQGEYPDDIESYKRLEQCWNVYYHGFNDDHDDIAYVKETTRLEPGIYEVVVEGEECYLFLWEYVSNREHPRNLKGLITRVVDVSCVQDALKKYESRSHFI